jgi:alpha-galactosidase
MHITKALLSILIPIMVPLSLGSVSSPNLLPTPPMGFNNWARFMCDLNETLFLETASAMISTGLLEAGYNRLNLDDCWMAYDRAPDSSLQWNTTKFPHGIPWLAYYLKTQGFHLGIYQDAGNLTCGGYPGSFGHEALDAQTFAAWGIDYLKLDGCNVFPEHSRTLEEEYKARYSHWHNVLKQMHPPLVFSESAPAYFSDPTNLTSWYEVMDWVPAFGELARHSTDILVYVGEGSAWDSIMVNYHYNTLLARYQRPGYFNDPDFLIPDHPGLTLEEKRSQFALWASFSAPLIVSAYIPGLSGEELAILRNKELIRLDQDALGLQATLASRGEEVDVLTRSLEDGDRLLTVLNRADGVAMVRVPVEWMGLHKGCEYVAASLWDGEAQVVAEEMVIRLNSHATQVYRIALPEECSTVIPTGIVFNTASGNCLTDDDGERAGFEACRGSERQIWQVSELGSLRPLSRTSHCLTAGSQISVDLCTGHQDQRWTYAITGNLKNEHTKMCLTEGEGISECGFERDSQVFGLPSGVDIKSG